MVYDPQVGKQKTYFIEPDIMVMEFVGIVLPEEATEMCRRHEEWSVGRKQVFFAIDAAKLEKMEPEVRRIANESMLRMPVRGLAIHSAPLKARVIIKLVLTAFKLFGDRADKAPLVYFSSRDEAFTWINDRRAALDAANTD
ncbi:MAG TPA: hypothetical protein VGS22_12355 [Thermoanaerobaculia bacterium]|jgi:hypothetical protein|nr:hypothetical protein [Thermoanaerobaculia bacterium]